MRSIEEVVEEIKYQENFCKPHDLYAQLNEILEINKENSKRLKYIENVARDCFSDVWQGIPDNIRDAHRTQALANIFCVFEYDGKAIPQSEIDKIENKGKEQVTFDDLLG